MEKKKRRKFLVVFLTLAMAVCLLPVMAPPAAAADVTTSLSGTLTTVNSFYRPNLGSTGGSITDIHVGPEVVPTTYLADTGAIYQTEDSLFNYFTVNFTPAVTGNYTFTVTSASLSPAASDHGYGTSTGAADDTTMFIYLAGKFNPDGTITFVNGTDQTDGVSDVSGPLKGLMYGQDDIAASGSVYSDLNNYRSQIASGTATVDSNYPTVGQFSAGTTYTLVLTSYQSGVTGTINVDITGPGSVTISSNSYTSGYATAYTATINTRTNGSAADVSGSVELKQGGSTIATASKTSTGTYTASVVNGTYDIYVNNADTETDLTINNGANSATIDYYTVTYSVSNAGTAAGSSISATAGGDPINSGDKVLAGKQVIITAAGAGATSYTYAWSGAGSSGETTAALTITTLSSAVNATCTVTGTTAYTATINTRTDGSAADVTGSVELKQGGSTIATASKSATGTYTASVGNGTYDIYINNADTETDLTINNGANSATIDYYTVTYSVSNAGTAAGSSISATAGGTAINSGDKVLAGKQVIITAAGAGATSYTYAWSGAGSSGETTAALTIAALSSAVNATCTVTGITAYTATINTRTDGSLADVTGSVELKQGGSTKATASKTAAGTYTASVVNGTYDIYINNADTGTDLTINNGANSAAINYYTVTYSVSNAGTAAGSSISATAGGTAINSGDKVLAGKQVIITATGAGATSYTYLWSGTGSSGETTVALTIAALSSAVNATCTVTGTTTSATQLSTPANLAWDSQTTGKATWSLVNHALSYDVQLKKDGSGIGNAQSVTEAVYEFAPAINANGYGSYTFAVTAIGDGITYSNSPTVVSSVYEYAAFSSPLCSVLGVVLPADTTLDGLNINAAVSKGTTTQQIDVTVSDNAAWKLYSDSACTNEITDKTMTLAVGGNTAYLKVTAQDGATSKIYTVTITRRGSSGDDGSPGSSGSPSSSSPPGATSDSGANVLVNGESQSAGTLETTTNPEGQTVTTVTVDTDKLNQILEAKGGNATVTISAATGSNIVTGVLTGQMVKSMEEKEATLVVQSGSAVYTVPAAEINIDAVSEQLGQNVTLKDITVEVAIATPSAQTIAAAEQAAADSGFSIVVPAVEFTINCTYNGTTVEVSKFNTYIERTIALPEGADPNKITTGIVVKPDGTTYHVPTRVTLIDGKYYVVINSLTNSTYTVVWHPIEFSDVKNHWAKEAINDMGSRMIVSGVDQENYAPDQDITRAEFAAIMVKSLGLAPGTGETRFSDVENSKWYCEYIKTASSYDIIYGYGDKTFGPNDTITREQVMTIIARVMKITGLDCSLADGEAEKLLQTYSDSADASGYARESIAACLKTGLVSGKSVDTMAPKDNISRAETAVMVQRLLQKSDLI